MLSLLRVVLLMVVVATACDTEEQVAHGRFDADSYCKAEFKLQTLGAFESEDVDERKAYAAGTIRPAHERAREHSPEQVRDDFDVLIDAAREMESSGDPSDFGSDRAQDARRAIHAVDLETCRWTRIEVDAIEYEFEGLTTEPHAGRSSVELANRGKEPHELVLYRVNDGVTETIEQLLALPEEEVLEKVARVGAAFAEPGKSDFSAVDLKPGRYGAVCFIPVGGEDGPPHFTEGMYTEFTVR